EGLTGDMRSFDPMSHRPTPHRTAHRRRGVGRMKRLLMIIAALLPLLLAVTPASASAVGTTTIVNGSPGTFRFDVHGNAIDAHDGEIQRFGDTYYLYGTSYGCGYVRLERPTT